VIALALDCGAIRLSQDRRNLLAVEEVHLGRWRFLRWDAQDPRALGNCGWLVVGHEPEETADRRQTAISSSDRDLSLFLTML
jgi:hypothetical protein